MQLALAFQPWPLSNLDDWLLASRLLLLLTIAFIDLDILLFIHLALCLFIDGHELHLIDDAALDPLFPFQPAPASLHASLK